MEFTNKCPELKKIFYTHVQCLNEKLSVQYKLFWANKKFYVCDNKRIRFFLSYLSQLTCDFWNLTENSTCIYIHV